jgi:hypothetical protein
MTAPLESPSTETDYDVDEHLGSTALFSVISDPARPPIRIPPEPTESEAEAMTPRKNRRRRWRLRR